MKGVVRYILLLAPLLLLVLRKPEPIVEITIEQVPMDYIPQDLVEQYGISVDQMVSLRAYLTEKGMNNQPDALGDFGIRSKHIAMSFLEHPDWNPNNPLGNLKIALESISTIKNLYQVETLQAMFIYVHGLARVDTALEDQFYSYF